MPGLRTWCRAPLGRGCCGQCRISLRGGAGCGNGLVDHRFQFGCTGSLILGHIIRPCRLDVHLAADHLRQILVGDILQLRADISGLRGQADQIVVRRQILHGFIHEAGDDPLGIIHKRGVLFSGPLVAVVDGVGQAVHQSLSAKFTSYSVPLSR